MNQFFRFTSVYFTRLLFGLLLFLLPSAFLFTFFFSHPDYIKQTLRDSQAYTYVSRLVVSQATASFAVNTENYGLSQGAVETAAKKAFHAQILQKTAEQNIDEAYKWLYGQRDAYTPDLNFDENQQIFMQEIAKASSEGVVNKPECTPEYIQQVSAQQGGQVPVITELNCRPRGVDQNILQQQLLESLQTGTSQPTQSNMSLNTTSQTPLSPETPVMSSTTVAMVPYAFQIMSIGFYLVVAGILIVMGIYYLLYKKSLVTLTAVGKPLLTTGILLIVYGVFSWWFFVENAFGKLFSTTENTVLQNSLRPFTEITVKTFICFGILYMVVAIILFVIHRKNKHPLNPTPQAPPEAHSVQTKV